MWFLFTIHLFLDTIHFCTWFIQVHWSLTCHLFPCFCFFYVIRFISFHMIFSTYFSYFYIWFSPDSFIFPNDSLNTWLVNHCFLYDSLINSTWFIYVHFHICGMWLYVQMSFFMIITCSHVIASRSSLITGVARLLEFTHANVADVAPSCVFVHIWSCPTHIIINPRWKTYHDIIFP